MVPNEKEAHNHQSTFNGYQIDKKWPFNWTFLYNVFLSVFAVKYQNKEELFINGWEFRKR